MPFEDTQVIATFDRSWGDRKEQLQLERGEYNGKPTFALRVLWKTPDGQWRWSPKKPTANGKTWESLNLKARELRALGEALIAASSDAPTERSGPSRTEPTRAAHVDDDIPF